MTILVSYMFYYRNTYVIYNTMTKWFICKIYNLAPHVMYAFISRKSIEDNNVLVHYCEVGLNPDNLKILLDKYMIPDLCNIINNYLYTTVLEESSKFVLYK
jgi:hypothetical protein